LSLDDHRSKHVSDVDFASYDRIYCMSAGHAEQLRNLHGDVRIVGGPAGVVDPFGGSPAVYASTADQLANEAQEIAQSFVSKER